MAEVDASDEPAAREELFFPRGGQCFGCSPDNPAGLRLRFFRDPAGVRCETTVAVAYQGAPDVVHGGIQAVLLDETCCAAAYFTRGGFVVTGALELRYRRPCPVGTPLVVTARIVADEGRFLRIRGEIREAAEAARSEPITIAEGKFYPNPARSADGAR
jgi:acyl-coenzyme A thioesterase PaaI-like protein